MSENLYNKYPMNKAGIAMTGSMLVLSDQQRLDAYVWAYKNFMKIDSGPYLCNVMISYVMGDFRFTHMNFPNDNIMHLFPELFSEKPVNCEPKRPWWLSDQEGNLARMIALKNAVIKVKHLIDNKDILS